MMSLNTMNPNQLVYRLRHSVAGLSPMDITALLKMLVEKVERLENAQEGLEDNPTLDEPIGDGALATTRREIIAKATKPPTPATARSTKK